LVSPHQVAEKYQSLSTKNEEIRTKVKHFDFSLQQLEADKRGNGSP